MFLLFTSWPCGPGWGGGVTEGVGVGNYPLFPPLRTPLGTPIRALMNYTQIVNVFRLHNRIEPSAALFWALGIGLKQLTQPASPASLKFGRGQLGSI